MALRNTFPGYLVFSEAGRESGHRFRFCLRLASAALAPAPVPKKLLAEAEGILAWAVEGAMEWWRIGLDKPPEL